MNYKITWQKPNGAIIERFITHNPYYEKGYVNSYNWQVIDIKVMRNNMWLDITDYNKEVYKATRSQFRSRTIKNFINDYRVIILFLLVYILTKLI